MLELRTIHHCTSKVEHVVCINLVCQIRPSYSYIFRMLNCSVAELVMARGLVCPLKAQEFDEVHSRAPRFGRNNSGARELAGGYTRGMAGGGAYMHGVSAS